MSFNYLVHFQFAHPESSLRPADQQWGYGSIPINTDKKPETDEEFKEIARYIGTTLGYETVAITKINPTDKFLSTQEVLEGIVID